MHSTHTELLPFPQMPLAARRAHVFPEFQNKALISIGQFCDSNFTAVFRKGQVKLINYDTTITGQRDPSTGLYYIDLPEQPPVSPQSLHPFSCSAYEIKTKSELVQYLHRCDFSPVVHTWTKAIDAEYFATWPVLTSELVRKHLPNSLATTKGHLKQDRQNIRLAKPSIVTAPLVLPIQHAPPVQSHQVFVETVELTGKVSTDQTGRFPVTSSRARKYLMVLYNHDINEIIPNPIKSQSESELIRAYAVLHSMLA